MESIIKQPNIIYENKPHQLLLTLEKEYDMFYRELTTLTPGTRKYEELKKQGQENIQVREKIVEQLLSQHVGNHEYVGVRRW